MNRLRRTRLSTVLLGAVTALVLVFLLAPIITAVIYSFNEGTNGRQTADLTGFTTHWFGDAWNNTQATDALRTSLEVAVCAATIAAIVGTAAGFVLARGRGIYTTVVEVLVLLLLIVPEIVLAVALLLFYSKSGVTLGFVPLVGAHTPFTTAVVALIVRSRVVALDRSLEDAAADLGAGGVRSFLDIQLPLVRPAILAGAMLAFIFSFDALVISVFLTTPTVNTLPVYLFSSVRSGIRPDVFAIATMMLAFTLTCLAITALIYRWQSRRAGSKATTVGVLAGGEA